MTSRRAFALAAIVLAPIPVIAATATAATSTSARSYTVTGLDFRFRGLPKSIPAGTHTFVFVNRGEATHDFKIGKRKTRILNPGQRATLRLTLKKGRYQVLCTVPGHAPLGMKTTLVVR